MITPEQIFDLFETCYMQIVGDEDCTAREYYDSEVQYTNQEAEMTEFQWQTLVKVCEVIVENRDRFDMSYFHNSHNECGTSHCIGGWAVSVVLNNYDLCYLGQQNINVLREKYNVPVDSYGTAMNAAALVSSLVYPFFYLTGDNSDSKCTTEQATEIIMNDFILPVLEIAKQENKG